MVIYEYAVHNYVVSKSLLQKMQLPIAFQPVFPFSYYKKIFILRGDKVSMLPVHTHTNYPGKIKVTICNHHVQSPGWQPTLCVVWCLICWFASLEKYVHSWHWMSLLRPGVI